MKIKLKHVGYLPYLWQSNLFTKWLCFIVFTIQMFTTCLKSSISLEWCYCYNVCSIQYIKWHNFIVTMHETCSYRQPSKLCNRNITRMSDLISSSITSGIFVPVPQSINIFPIATLWSTLSHSKTKSINTSAAHTSITLTPNPFSIFTSDIPHRALWRGLLMISYLSFTVLWNTIPDILQNTEKLPTYTQHSIICLS